MSEQRTKTQTHDLIPKRKKKNFNPWKDTFAIEQPEDKTQAGIALQIFLKN